MICAALDLAEYIVEKCSTEHEPVSNLQLQKILYFLQTVYCRATEGDLLFDDEFEAWPYGPVLPAVYAAYSRFGGRVITETRATNLIAASPIKKFIDDGITSLRRKSPWELVRTSHAMGSPWAKIWNDGNGYKATIPNDLIIQSALHTRN